MAVGPVEGQVQTRKASGIESGRQGGMAVLGILHSLLGVARVPFQFLKMDMGAYRVPDIACYRRVVLKLAFERGVGLRLEH